LPCEIGNLTNLKWIKLYNNRLTYLPEDFGRLKKLVTCDVGNNSLIALPKEMINLSKLTYLSISENTNMIYPPDRHNIDCLYDVHVVMDYLRNNDDIYSKRGRRKHLWPNIRLMYIGHCDTQSRFSMIPIELLNYIETFIVSDPYINPDGDTHEEKMEESF